MEIKTMSNEELLKGMDLTQTETLDGWWETSVGAEFGAKIKAELLSRLNDYEKYKAFWEYSRLADKQSFEMYEWKEVK